MAPSLAAVPSYRSGDYYVDPGQSFGYEPIAIVGMSLRFPGQASSIQGFWDLMLAGRCASRSFPKDRISVKGIHHPDRSRQDTVRAQPRHPFICITDRGTGTIARRSLP